MAKKSTARKATDFVVNPAQLGGIRLTQDLEGPGYGTRSAWVNTGAGLNYRVTVDRGLDIADAFYNGMSLTWLSLGGVTKPEISMNRGLDWLWGFFGGLVVTCGPSSAGAPCKDGKDELPLHGYHSNTPATIESIVNPDPRRGVDQMSVTGIVNNARLFKPVFQVRRTISSPLGKNVIVIDDEITNLSNQPADHAWLLHINLGYPLIEPGTKLVFDGKVNPLPGAEAYFAGDKFKTLPEPLEAHKGFGESVAYIDPKADRSGMVHCGVVNESRGLGLKISFSKKDYPRFANWHHFGPNGQYVMGIEPANCGVEGRPIDRERGWLQVLAAGETVKRRATIEVVAGKEDLAAFKKLGK